jgi:hypothetical protein
VITDATIIRRLSVVLIVYETLVIAIVAVAAGLEWGGRRA